MKGSNLGTMLENHKQNEGIESGNDTGEPETNEGIESGRNANEPETKRRDRIRARCRRTQNKKGSNLDTMPENPKQNRLQSEKKNHERGECHSMITHECVQRRKEGAMPRSKASIPCQRPTIAHKVKVTKLKILPTFIHEEKPSSLIHNIQYPPTTDRGYAPICTSETQISQ